MNADPTPGESASHFSSPKMQTSGKPQVRAAPSNVGLHQRLVFGFSAQALTMIVLMVERIIMVPLYLAAWGVGLYEDWLFLGAIAGFLRLLDLGMEWHFGNALRLSLAAGRRDLFHHNLAVGIGCYLVVMIVSGVLLTVTLFTIVPGPVFDTAVLDPDTANLVLCLMLVLRILLMPRTFITGIYSAHGDFSRGENMFTLFTSGQALVIIVLLILNASPVTVSLVALASIFFTCWIPIISDLRRRYPEVHYRIAIPTRAELVEICRNAGFYFFTNSAEILLNNGPVVLLGILFRQPGGILIFTVGRTLTGIARQLAIQFAKSSAIEMARQTAQGDRTGLLKLHIATGRTISAMTGLLCGLILSAAEPMIHIWTGGKAPFDFLIILTFVCGVLIAGPAQSSVTLLQLGNVPRPLAISSFVRITLVCTLTVALVPLFGALGAAVALAYAEAMAFGVLASHYANQRYGLPSKNYALLTYSTGTACLLLGGGVGIGLGHLMEVDNLWKLITFMILWGAIVIVPAFYIVFTGKQRDHIRAYMKRFSLSQANRARG